jgi:hypothetical protein
VDIEGHAILLDPRSGYQPCVVDQDTIFGSEELVLETLVSNKAGNPYECFLASRFYERIYLLFLIK